MRLFFAVLFLVSAFSIRSVAADKPSKVDVIVLQAVPINHSYNWFSLSTEKILCNGSPCTSCDANQQQCVLYKTTPASETRTAKEAELKLLFPSGEIYIVHCTGKVDLGAELAMLASNVPQSTTYRDCRIPDVNTKVQAEITKWGVKLYMTSSGRHTNETYIPLVKLQPKPGSPPLFTHESQPK